MQVLYAILLGMLQGVLEFIPVSSLGHLSVFEELMGLPKEAGLLFEAMLHLGTMGALIMVFQKDVKRLLLEGAGILSDLSGNFGKYIRKKHVSSADPSSIRYSRIITNVYRKMVLMILLTTVPTVILGFVCRNLAVMAFRYTAFSGFGLLIMGVFMLVVDMSGVGGVYGPGTSRFDQAAWIGIVQGISVFPGFSRSGLTIGTGLMCGFERKFAVKYSFLCAIPVMLGAFIVEIPQAASAGISAFQGFVFVMGMISAFITGTFTARFLIKILENVKIKFFAEYCFIAGVLALMTATPL